MKHVHVAINARNVDDLDKQDVLKKIQVRRTRESARQREGGAGGGGGGGSEREREKERETASHSSPPPLSSSLTLVHKHARLCGNVVSAYFLF